MVWVISLWVQIGHLLNCVVKQYQMEQKRIERESDSDWWMTHYTDR